MSFQWVPTHPASRGRSSSLGLHSTLPDSSYLSFGDGTLSQQTFSDLYTLSSSITSAVETENTNDDGISHPLSYYLPDWLTARCIECGWKYPTLIQKKALDVILRGNDCVIQAQTGSGKTLSYLLPLLASVDPNRSAIQALIIVPTRELGLQVGRVAKRLAAGSGLDQRSTDSHEDWVIMAQYYEQVKSDVTRDCDDYSTNEDDQNESLHQKDGEKHNNSIPRKKSKIMIMNVLQGSTNRRQRAWAWAEPPHVVIGTPVELSKMVSKGGIRYNAVRFIVVDEVDACLGPHSHSSSNSMTWSLAGSGPLHELLSRYLSPTYDDAFTAVSNKSRGHSTISSNIIGVTTLANSINAISTRNKPFMNHRQTVFASATIPQQRHFIRQCIKNKWTIREPEFVCTSPGELIPPTLSHKYVVCANNDQKVNALKRMILKEREKGRLIKRALVFCDLQRDIDGITDSLLKNFGAFLWSEGITSDDVPKECKIILSVLRYEDSISARASAMEGFRDPSKEFLGGRVFAGVTESSIDNSSDTLACTNITAETESNVLRIMISSDLAARGIDVVDVSHIFNFDLPNNSEVYVHRAGRAGRLGQRGVTFSIITADQEFALERLANKLGVSIQCVARQNPIK